ncbi:hypothetical protein CCP4SC76_3420006 [Gammaproteobacteria bacterium]
MSAATNDAHMRQTIATHARIAMNQGSQDHLMKSAGERLSPCFEALIETIIRSDRNGEISEQFAVALTMLVYAFKVKPEGNTDEEK